MVLHCTIVGFGARAVSRKTPIYFIKLRRTRGFIGARLICWELQKCQQKHTITIFALTGSVLDRKLDCDSLWFFKCVLFILRCTIWLEMHFMIPDCSFERFVSRPLVLGYYHDDNLSMLISDHHSWPLSKHGWDLSLGRWKKRPLAFLRPPGTWIEVLTQINYWKDPPHKNHLNSHRV